MKYYFSLLLFITVIVSCENHQTNEYDESCEIQYKITLRDNHQYISYLLENIKNNLSENFDSSSYHKFNSEYITYLDSISIAIKNNGEGIFFDGEDNYSSIGKKFILRTKTFEEKTLKLVNDTNFKARLHYIVNTNDLEAPNVSGMVAANNLVNERKHNVVYFKYLDYYFKGLSKIHIEALLSNKKRALLELENEYQMSH